MNDTPPEQPEETQPAPEPPEASPEPSETSEAPEKPNEEKNMRPFYKRPGPIIGILVLILILVVILPPIVAQEVPVGLNDEGERYAQDWTREDGEGTTTALAGLVFVDPVTLTREGPGETPTGVYVYTTVKIPAMLPQGIVNDQMRDNALELLADNGVQVNVESATTEDYDGNGHDATITTYSAVAQSADFFVAETEVNLFITTWRCSLLGSHAVAVGAVPDPAEGLFENGGGDLEEIEQNLLANTQCNR